MEPIILDVPKYMSPEDVAVELNSYLLGPAERNNHNNSLGPFLDEHSSSKFRRWLLGTSNDYWLRETDDGRVQLTWRYNEEIAQALAALFKAKHS